MSEARFSQGAHRHISKGIISASNTAKRGDMVILYALDVLKTLLTGEGGKRMGTIIIDTISRNTIIQFGETAMASGEIADVFMAGHQAHAGVYRQLESGRVVQIEADDYLPASLDGQVACYVRVANNEKQKTVETNINNTNENENSVSEDEFFELKIDLKEKKHIND